MSRKNIDICILLTIFMGVFVLRYFRVEYERWYFLNFFILLHVWYHRSSSRISIITLSSYIFVALVALYNLMQYGFSQLFVDNILSAMAPVTLFTYVAYLSRVYSHEEIEDLFYTFTKFLNVYFFINVPIIFIQISTHSFLMEKFIGFNPYVQDHITGLLGQDGTPVLAFMWTLLVLLNFYFAKVKENKLFLSLAIIQFPVMMYISNNNDNKSFIVIFLLLVAQYFVFPLLGSISRIQYKTFVRIMVISIISIVSIGLAYIFVTVFQDLVDQVIVGVMDFTKIDTGRVDRNNERAYLLDRAFTKYNAWTTGSGIGEYAIGDKRVHVHFGINSMSLLLIQGGMFYFLAVTSAYAAQTTSIFKQNRVIIYVIMFVNFIVLASLGQVFRDQYSNVFLVATYLLFTLKMKPEEEL